MELKELINITQLAKLFSVTRQAVHKWVNGPDWKFGKGPWPVAKVPSIHQWALNRPGVEDRKYGDPVRFEGYAVPMALAPPAVEWICTIAESFDGELPPQFSIEHAEKMAGHCAEFLVGLISTRTKGGLKTLPETENGWKRLAQCLTEDDVAELIKTRGKIAYHVLTEAGIEV